jgi:hypothetical protein
MEENNHEELHSLYILPYTSTFITLRTDGGGGCVKKIIIYIKSNSENLKRIDNLRDVKSGLEDNIKINRKEIVCDGMDGTRLIQYIVTRRLKAGFCNVHH